MNSDKLLLHKVILLLALKIFKLKGTALSFDRNYQQFAASYFQLRYCLTNLFWLLYFLLIAFELLINVVLELVTVAGMCPLGIAVMLLPLMVP